MFFGFPTRQGFLIGKENLKPANIIFPYELWILYKVDNFNSIEVSNFGSIGILIF